MNVYFSDKFKSELTKAGGNVIISGVRFFKVNDLSRMLVSIDYTATESNLIPVIGSKNEFKNTLETYFELPDIYKRNDNITFNTIVYYWNEGARSIGEDDTIEWAFIVFDEYLYDVYLSKNRNLITIELPEDSNSNIVFSLSEGDFKFLEYGDPFIQENLSRDTLDITRAIFPESFYHEAFLNGTSDGKPLDTLGRDNRAFTYKKFKELLLTCDSTIEEFGKTIRYGLCQEVKYGELNCQYFQGTAIYDEYTYSCGELTGIEKNLSMPINSVPGVYLVSEDVNPGNREKNTNFTVNNYRFCVEYDRMKDILHCTSDVHAELKYHDIESGKICTLKSNTIRITQQPEDTSLIVVSDYSGSTKYYRTTKKDKDKYGIESGTVMAVIIPDEEKDTTILVHSLNPISPKEVSLDYNEPLRDTFDISIKRVDVENQNIEIRLKVRSIEGYTYKQEANWHPLKELTEFVEPWLYPVTVTSGEHTTKFCPVVKNAYTEDAELQWGPNSLYIKVNERTVGTRQIFGLANPDESITFVNNASGEKSNGYLLSGDTQYTIRNTGSRTNLVVYQSDSVISNYKENTDWRKEVTTYLYPAPESYVPKFDIELYEGKENLTEKGITTVSNSWIRVNQGIGVYKISFRCNSSAMLFLSDVSSNIGAHFYGSGGVQQTFSKSDSLQSAYVVVDRYTPAENCLFKVLAKSATEESEEIVLATIELAAPEKVSFVSQLDAYKTFTEKNSKYAGSIYLFSTVHIDKVTTDIGPSPNVTYSLNIVDNNGVPEVPSENVKLDLEFENSEGFRSTGFRGIINGNLYCYIAARAYIKLFPDSDSNRLVIPAEKGGRLNVTSIDQFIDGRFEVYTHDTDSIKITCIPDENGININSLYIENISDSPKEVLAKLYIQLGPSKTLNSLNLSSDITNITEGQYLTSYEVSPSRYSIVKKISSGLALYGSTEDASYLGEERVYEIVSDNGSSIPEKLLITSDSLTIKNLGKSDGGKKLEFKAIIPSRVNDSDYYYTQEGYNKLREESKNQRTHTISIRTENGMVSSSMEIIQGGISQALVVGNGINFPIAVPGSYGQSEKITSTAGNISINFENATADIVLGVLNLLGNSDVVEYCGPSQIKLTCGEEVIKVEPLDNCGLGLGISSINGASTKPNVRVSIEGVSEPIVAELFDGNRKIADNIIKPKRNSVRLEKYPESIAFSSGGSLITGDSENIDGNKIVLKSYARSLKYKAIDSNGDEIWNLRPISTENTEDSTHPIKIKTEEREGDNGIVLEEDERIDDRYLLWFKVKENNSGRQKDDRVILRVGTTSEEDADGILEDTFSITAYQGHYSAFYSIGLDTELYPLESEIVINNIRETNESGEYSTNLIYLMIQQQEYYFNNGSYQLGDVKNISWTNENLCDIHFEGDNFTVSGAAGDSHDYITSMRPLEVKTVGDGHYFSVAYSVNPQKQNETFSIRIPYTMTLKYPMTSSEYNGISKEVQGELVINHNGIPETT